jgi:hypothetical protein
MEDVLLARGT